MHVWSLRGVCEALKGVNWKSKGDRFVLQRVRVKGGGERTTSVVLCVLIQGTGLVMLTASIVEATLSVREQALGCWHSRVSRSRERLGSNQQCYQML